MIVSSGYRKNGFDAHGGKLLQKKYGFLDESSRKDRSERRVL